MVRDWVLDNLDQLLLGRGGSNLMSVQQLHHQTSEALECTWNAHCEADPDEDILRSLDVDLEFAGLIDRRIEKSEQTLWRHVSSMSFLQLPLHGYVPGA